MRSKSTTMPEDMLVQRLDQETQFSRSQTGNEFTGDNAHCVDYL